MNITSDLQAHLQRLPNVQDVTIHGDAVMINTNDSDTTLRALLNQFADARDIEVAGGGIEEAFLALTAETARNAEVAP
jgi:ABC-2 type transport system ATP-binding protein